MNSCSTLGRLGIPAYTNNATSAATKKKLYTKRGSALPKRRGNQTSAGGVKDCLFKEINYFF